ncbi:hypothetical protein INT80_04620 [Gallibacterium anatis]|uniref:Uncharacterized protein n=1 Tax=Gallibacterium anatis TaxID=750 RepID=A0A930UWD7_9PAST|nr:hypothetical protein [Gallibacterium anatis]
MSDNPFTTAPMLDLNDLFLFAQVVKCGGFNATSRQTNIPKQQSVGALLNWNNSSGLRITTSNNS